MWITTWSFWSPKDNCGGPGTPANDPAPKAVLRFPPAASASSIDHLMKMASKMGMTGWRTLFMIVFIGMCICNKNDMIWYDIKWNEFIWFDRWTLYDSAKLDYATERLEFTEIGQGVLNVGFSKGLTQARQGCFGFLPFFREMRLEITSRFLAANQITIGSYPLLSILVEILNSYMHPIIFQYFGWLNLRESIFIP